MGTYIDKDGKEKERTVEVRFSDTLRFMQDSLANLVSNLSPESFEILKRFFPDEEQFELLLRKGVFPYDFFDGFNKLNAKKLPPIEAFYSIMNECGIEDHQHAKKVWEVFAMKTLRDYHNTYLIGYTARKFQKTLHESL